MKQHFLLLQLLCIITAITHAQNVDISIFNKDALNGSEITYGRSLDGKPIHYLEMIDKTAFYNGVAHIPLNIDSTMLILIGPSPYMPKLRLVVCPGDTVLLQVDHDSISKKTILVFNGNNAKGSEVYYTSNLFLGSRLETDVYHMLKNANNLNDAIIKAEQLRTNLFFPMDSLLKLKMISDNYYKFVKLEAEAEFMNAIIDVAGLTDFRYETEKKNIKLSKEDLRELQKEYCEKYDPFSSKYKNTWYRPSNARSKCKLIQNGIIAPTLQTNLGLWKDKDIVYNYAPPDIQEQMFATHSIFSMKIGLSSLPQLQLDYEKFKNVFPKSVFLQAFENLLSEKKKNIIAGTFGYYNSSAGILTVKGIDTLSNLQNFINCKFLHMLTHHSCLC